MKKRITALTEVLYKLIFLLLTFALFAYSSSAQAPLMSPVASPGYWVNLKTMNGNYVTIIHKYNTGGSMSAPLCVYDDQNCKDSLEGKAASVSVDETFWLIDRNGGTLNNGDSVNLLTWRGYYVTAKAGEGKEVNADSTQALGGETFIVKKLRGAFPGDKIAAGDEIAIQASNGKYMTVEHGGAIKANKDKITGWGNFVSPEPAGSRLTLKSIKCIDQEDWTGSDSSKLKIAVDGAIRDIFNKDMKSGQTWDINKTYDFKQSVKIGLIDIDDVDDDKKSWRDLDKDDYLGDISINAATSTGTGLSQTIKYDPPGPEYAEYVLFYDLTTPPIQPKGQESFLLEFPKRTLTLHSLRCLDQEDWTGKDSAKIKIMGDVLRKEIKEGDTWNINKTYSFSQTVKIELIDIDDVDDDKKNWRDLDKDDFLGDVSISAFSQPENGLSKRFVYNSTAGGAEYVLTYDLGGPPLHPGKARAMALLNEFANSTRPGKFTQIVKDKPRLISEIRRRIVYPDVMEQGSQSLCGPIAALMVLIQKDPERYVQMARSMYEDGKFEADKDYIIKPDDHLYTAAVPKIEDDALVRDMPHVDWMLAASMRDHENAIVDYEDEWLSVAKLKKVTDWLNKNIKKEKLAGITTPWEMKKWFERLIRFRRVDFLSTLVWGESEALRQVHTLDDGDMAALMVDNDFWPDKDPAWFNFPTHWVVVLRVYKAGEDGQFGFQVFSWGADYGLRFTDEDRFEDFFQGVVIGYQ